MPEIDLGSITTLESYFLQKSIPITPFVEQQPLAGSYRHCFTYRGSAESIRDAVIELIRGARRKIYIASFRIGDSRLFEALFEAVERLHGSIYVITSWTENTLRRGLSEIEDYDTADIIAQKKRFDELTRRGIAVRGHEDCHAKFLVVDDEIALVSSANLETSALADQPGRGATGESGVVLIDKTEVDRLGRFFTRMWYSECTWYAPPGADYALQRRAPTATPVTVRQSTGPFGVVWTDKGELGILAAIHEIIELAREELLLGTFALAGVREQPAMLLDPLQRAMARRGLRVHLLVRGRNNRPEHRADTAALADLGVEIHADSRTHTKAAIADGRFGALFSANIDATHGLFGGVEVGVRLDNQPALSEARRYLLHSMTFADQRFVSRPSQHELNSHLGAWWQTEWSREDRIVTSATDPVWQSFQEATTTGPILWEDSNEGLRLFADAHSFILSEDRDMTHLILAGSGGLSARARLESWYDDRRKVVGRTSSRGLCTAVIERAQP